MIGWSWRRARIALSNYPSGRPAPPWSLRSPVKRSVQPCSPTGDLGSDDAAGTGQAVQLAGLKPHAGQEGAGVSLTGPAGGQAPASSEPCARPHNRQLNSALKRTTERWARISSRSWAVAAGGISLSNTSGQAATTSVCWRTRRNPCRGGWRGMDHCEPRSLARRRYNVERTS